MRLSRRSLSIASSALLLAVPVSTWAQGVVLQLKPHVGDTVHMQLDQESEMTGTRGKGAAASSSSVVTDLRIYSRAVIEGLSGAGATVLAITDSVAMSSSDARASRLAEQTRRMLEGRQIRLRLAPDGTAALLEGPGEPDADDVSRIIAIMPAAFPRGAVRVGDSWTREMPLPSRAGPGGRPSGRLHATFRLDSVSRHGAKAYLSMYGELTGDDFAPGGGRGLALDQHGTVSGTMLLDRRRGWLAESRFVIEVESELAKTVGGMDPMRFRMKITQRTRTLDRR